MNNGIKHERVRFSLPTRELERRWQAVRTAMKDKDIDIIVVQNNNKWLGGYVRWFTDVSAQHGYPMTILFPANDEMTIISHGSPPLPPAPPAYALRGVRERIPVPYMRTLNYTDSMEPETIAAIIKARNDKRIGIVSPGNMPYPFLAGLKERLPHVEFVDFTDEIDGIKAVKSEDEWYFIRKAVELQDRLCAAMPVLMRPGMYEYEVRQRMVYFLEEQGSEEQLFSLSSAPIGSFAGHTWVQFQNRRIERGDNIFIMIEVNGPGGMYGEIARIWCLGEPTRQLLDFWQLALEGQKLIASLSKPGARPADILATYNEFLAEKGFPPENRLLAHGQGYDLVERPAYRPEEKMLLQTGMNIAIHPIVMNENTYAFCCDNYIIKEDGAHLLHTFPQEIIVID
ncbi:M24 family metallopeptidase [Moorella sulfitireducens]|uniref:M24 family metallopeptidase n=1 Tax=Neomoorella sulfitireducens TaxID=2972948 RepID=UPI0021AD31F2|nr:M24 family metallopeptidase [Moorella sulfitireducens]